MRVLSVAAAVALPLAISVAFADREDCSSIELPRGSPPTSVVRACLAWDSSQQALQNTLALTNQAGEVAKLNIGAPTYPWADVRLWAPTPHRQWFAIIYKSDVDRPDGKTYHLELFDVAARTRVFSAFATRVQIEDLDRDGVSELVLHQPVERMSYSIQLGWPHVYELGEALELSSVELFPQVGRAFIDRAQEMAARLGIICRDTGQATCPYARDIALLTSQIEAMKSMIQAR